MDRLNKIKALKQKIRELKEYLDDFNDSHLANKNKIANLENQLKRMKQDMSGYLDQLENVIDQK